MNKKSTTKVIETEKDIPDSWGKPGSVIYQIMEAFDKETKKVLNEISIISEKHKINTVEFDAVFVLPCILDKIEITFSLPLEEYEKDEQLEFDFTKTR